MNLDDFAKQYKELAASATHALIIGQTKFGKSDWVAQAVLDGWEVVYIDHDNGLSTLLDIIVEPEARRRVHYFQPANMFDFMSDFIKGGVIRYDSIKRATCNSSNVTPGAMVSEIYPARIPRNRVLCSLDSWTSLTMSMIQAKADALSIDLMDADKYGREIYGGTGFRAIQMAEAIQASPFHWIVQGHPAVYESKERPPNRTAEGITEKDMIIKETWQIPTSTSGPNGYAIGKFFNQIGWLAVDASGNRKLDFKTVKNRIGGGTPGGIDDPRKAYRFSTLFGKPDTNPVNPDSKPWIIEMTADEFKAAAALKHANAPKLTAAGVKTIPQSVPPTSAPVAVLTPAPTPTQENPAPRPKLNLAALQGKKS